MIEHTPKTQNSDTNNSINRLAETIAGIATQQRPQAATMLKPLSTNKLIFIGKNQKLELFDDLFHTMLKMQPEMTEVMQINDFHAHSRKVALQMFRSETYVHQTEKLLMTSKLYFDKNMSKQNHKLQPNINGTNLRLTAIQSRCPTSQKNSTNVLKESLVTTHNTW